MPSFLPPPAPNDANWEIVEARAYIGGSPTFVQNAALQQGDAMTTSAAALLAEDYQPGDETLTVDDATAFLPTNGTVNVIEVKGDGSVVNHWFTYYRIDIGTTFMFIQRIGGPDGPIPAGSAVSQWRELTTDAVMIKRYAELQGSQIVHACEIEGVDWNSLVHRQYASVYLEFRYWNSIYRQFSNWVPSMLCYLNPVRPTGFPGYTTWTAGAGCESKLLSITPTVPQQIGNIVIPYTVTASPHLEDPLQEPYEGNGAQDFSAQRLYDGDRMTPYVSRDAPSTLPAKPWYPTNPLVTTAGVGGVPTDAKNFGLKINTVYVSGVGVHQQDDHYIEVVNMGPDPTGWPFEDDVTAGIPATQDAETWGAVNLGSMSLETEGCRVYLGSKNGSDEQIMLPRNAVAILCRDRSKFEAANTVPEGTVIVEWGPCEGWMPGLDPTRLHRGIGGSFALHRRGGWVALREASRGGIRFRANYDLYSPPDATVASDGDLISVNGTLVCTDPLTGWASSGYIIPQSGQDGKRIYYRGISGNTFTGCIRVNPDPFGQSVILSGTGLRQGIFADKWRDFVAWGNANNPMPFWLEKGNGDLVDQNFDGVEAHRTWVYRGSNGYSDAPSSTPFVTVSPNGIPILTAIRRKNAMGGGVYQGTINGGDGPGTFEKHDGGTAMDWELVAGRPIGNRNPMDTAILIRMKLAEFPTARVTADDTATDTRLPIHVEAGTALPYPGVLLPGQRIRTNLGYDFVYQWRDDSTFWGVRKYNYAASPPFYAPGGGPTFAPGTTLTLIYDTNPAHWKKQNRTPRYEARNSYTPVGLDLRRFQRSPAVVVQEDTSRIDGKIRLVPGGDILPAGGGDLIATVALPGGPVSPPPGFAWGEAQFEYYPKDSPTFDVQYTSYVGDVLEGRIYARGYPDRYLPPGTTLTLRTNPSRVADCLIRVSRRPNPNDPLTYLGDGENPDWDNVHDGALSSDRTYLTLGAGGTLGPVTEIAVIVRRMSDNGRVKVNEIVPYSAIFDPPEAGSSSAASRPGAGSGGGRRLDAGFVGNEMLRLAGYPPNRRSAGGGPDVRGAKVSSGTWWEALTEWAERTGMIVNDGPLGVVSFKPDPRVYGRPPTQSTVVRISPEAVWGSLQAEEREQFRVSQVTLEATNDVALEHYVVTYPAAPIRLGTAATPVRDKRAPSLSAAKAWAKSLVARANGGWRLTIPVGQVVDLVQPGEIIRLDVPMDEAGVLFEGIDCFVLGTESTYRSGILTGTITVERWKTQ